MDPAQDAPAGPGGVGSGPVPGAGAIATAPRAHVRPCADVAAPVTPATNGAATTASSPAVNASPSHDALQCVKPAHVAAVSPDSPVTVFAGVGEVTARRLGEVGVRRVLDLAALADPAVADVAGHAKVRNLDDMVAAARAVCGSPAAAHAGGAARALVVGTGTGDASLPDVARLSLAESTPGGASPNGSVGTRSGVSPASRGAPGARARPSQARPPRSRTWCHVCTVGGGGAACACVLPVAPGTPAWLSRCCRSRVCLPAAVLAAILCSHAALGADMARPSQNDSSCRWWRCCGACRASL